jgi:hypothetical protein
MEATDTYNFVLMLSIVSMAGLVADGLEYNKVVGQSTYLFTIQVF